MNTRGNENLNYFQNSPYLRAMAWAIINAEGTQTHLYNTFFGGSRLASLANHPGYAVTIGNYTSSASGAYQFLTKTWNGLKAKLGLTDFSPASQDAAFVELLREKDALTPILNGDFETAIYRVRKVWASLPGAGYGQGEKTLSQLKKWYANGLQNVGASPAPTTPAISNSTAAAVGTGGLMIGALVLFLILE